MRSESSVRNRSARSVSSAGPGWSIGLSCSHGRVLVLECWPSLVVKRIVAMPVLSWSCSMVPTLSQSSALTRFPTCIVDRCFAARCSR